MSWIRLEAVAVDPALTEGLEARVADPAWLLARQWQTGEFRGDDAANPLLVEATATSFPTDRVLVGRDIVELDPDTPLEPLVEREDLRAAPGRQRYGADLGRLLVRRLGSVRGAGAFVEVLGQAHKPRFDLGPGPDPVGRRRSALLAARSIDGFGLQQAIDDDAKHLDGLLDEAGITDPRLRQRIIDVVAAWRGLVGGLLGLGAEVDAWTPERMEYGFELRATEANGSVLSMTTADGYVGGRLDWFSFDREPSKESEKGAEPLLRQIEVLPAPLQFRGMPASRFWELEGGDVYLGGIEAGPEDLARVAVAGYGVVYGDDWYLIPIRIPMGTVTEITNVKVIDDFDGASEIQSAAEVDGGTAGRGFKFFELTGDTNPSEGRAPWLLLPPTIETTDAARPLEDVGFLRDEAANLAWAVEQRIESRFGRSVDLANDPWSREEPDPADDAPDGWRLRLATSVPDQWVPLIPVLVGRAQNRAAAHMMFQRGRVPIDGSTETRGARGSLLEPDRRLLIHEEEIPSAGLRVVRRFQSARDQAGRLHTWIGRRKGPGRGLGESGLEFDRLERS